MKDQYFEKSNSLKSMRDLKTGARCVCGSTSFRRKRDKYICLNCQRVNYNR